MLLHKSQVYRHLLFNRLSYVESGLHPNVLKLATLLLLFDIYIKWFRIETMSRKQENFASGIDLFSPNTYWFDSPSTPFVLKYIYLLSMCVAETIVFHASVRLLISWLPSCRKTAILKYNYVSIALIISGFGRLLVLLMVIWDYNELEYSWLISIFVFTSNMEALSVFLNQSYLVCAFILISGLCAKALFLYLFKYTIDNQMAVIII